MNELHVDVLKLTRDLCKPCGKDIKISKEVLGGIAYLVSSISFYVLLSIKGITGIA